MNSTLEYIAKKFRVDVNQPSPIIIGLTRLGVPGLIKELQFSTGVEIGTERGAYAEKLCLANPQLKLFCVDPWTTIPHYESYGKQSEVNKIYKSAKSRLSNYNCQLLKMTSMEAVKQFQPNSLDFAFIDGNHYFEFVVNDIIYWSRIVKPGGVVYGHDYNSNEFHVKQAVNAFVDAHKIKPWFILHRDGMAIDSWLYVRQEEDKIFY